MEKLKKKDRRYIRVDVCLGGSLMPNTWPTTYITICIHTKLSTSGILSLDGVSCTDPSMTTSSICSSVCIQRFVTICCTMGTHFYGYVAVCACASHCKATAPIVYSCTIMVDQVDKYPSFPSYRSLILLCNQEPS